MIYANLILWGYGKEPKKGYPIKIQVGQGAASPTYIHCKRYCPGKDWDFKKQVPKKSAGNEMAGWVAYRKQRLIEEVNYCNDKSLSLLDAKELIENGIPDDRPVSNMGLLEFYDLRIQELESEERSTRAYQDMRDQLAAYIIDEDVPLSSVDYEFVNKFKQYKLRNGTKPNGLLSYLSNFRALMNEAKERKSLGLDKDNNPFRGNMPKKTRSRPQGKAMTFDEIKNLEGYKNQAHKYTPKVFIWKAERHIKMLLFQFYIGGHDYCDLSKLEWKDIDNGRIRFYRYKLRNRGVGMQVNNILLQPALDIIEEYGTPDEKRVFGFIPDIRVDEKKYHDHCGNVRRAMKTAFTQLEIEKEPVTKTMRHTFRTLARREFIDSDLIMEIMAHNPPGVQYEYQELFPEAEKDAALSQIVLKGQDPSPLRMVV